MIYTRDVLIKADVFPRREMKEVDVALLNDRFARLASARQANSARQWLDDGTENCKLCHLSLEFTEIRCPTCVTKKHRAHVRDKYCKHGRCAGHTKKEIVDFYHDNPKDDAEEFLQDYQDAEDIVSPFWPEDRGTTLDRGGEDAVEPEEPAQQFRMIRVRVPQKQAGGHFRLQAVQMPQPNQGFNPELQQDGQENVAQRLNFDEVEMEDEDSPLPEPSAPPAPEGEARDETAAFASTWWKPLPGGSNEFGLRRGYDGKPLIVGTPFGQACVVMNNPAVARGVAAAASHSPTVDDGERLVDIVDMIINDEIDQVLKDERRNLPSNVSPGNMEYEWDELTQYAAVTKVVHLGSREADCQEAWDALEKERLNIVEKTKVWDVSEAIPWGDVTYKNAKVMTVHPILGIKNYENR